MRWWLLPLGGLIVWAVHFVLLYGAASVAPGLRAANGAALIATVACAGADVGIIYYSLWRATKARDGFDRWLLDLGVLGAAGSLLAVLWQGLAALLV